MTVATPYRKLLDVDAPAVTCGRLRQLPPTIGRQAVDEAIALVTAAIRQNRNGRALSAARALLLNFIPALTTEQLKQAGALRQSTFEFRGPALDRLLMEWVVHAVKCGWSGVDVGYLTSIVELNTLAPPMRALYPAIAMRLHHQRSNVLQTLLADRRTQAALLAHGKRRRAHAQYVRRHRPRRCY